MRRLISALLIAVGIINGQALAQEYFVGTQPDSLFADSEVSTNVAFNANRTDTQNLEVRMDYSGDAHASISVAFGRDVNGNGDLEPEETELIVGRHHSVCFIEDVMEGNRYVGMDTGVSRQARYFRFSVVTNMRCEPRRMVFECENGAVNMNVDAKPWMFRRSWNLMKVKRRGFDLPRETCSVNSQYRAMLLLFR